MISALTWEPTELEWSQMKLPTRCAGLGLASLSQLTGEAYAESHETFGALRTALGKQQQWPLVDEQQTRVKRAQKQKAQREDAEKQADTSQSHLVGRAQVAMSDIRGETNSAWLGVSPV